MPKPAGRRPVLLLSRDDAYDVLNKYNQLTIRDSFSRSSALVASSSSTYRGCFSNCSSPTDRIFSNSESEDPQGALRRMSTRIEKTT